MNENINLEKQANNEPRKEELLTAMNPQHWLVPFSSSEKTYYSPYFLHPAFKIIFLLSFESNNPKIFAKVLPKYRTTNLNIFIRIEDPKKPQITNTNTKIKNINEGTISFILDYRCICQQNHLIKNSYQFKIPIFLL